MFAQKVLADTAGLGQSGAPGSNLMSTMMLMVVLFGIFYFILIRPQQKERQKLQSLLENLKAGDRVITTGGILGTVHSISGDEVQLKISDKTKITILKSAIRGLQSETAETQ